MEHLLLPKFDIFGLSVWGPMPFGAVRNSYLAVSCVRGMRKSLASQMCRALLFLCLIVASWGPSLCWAAALSDEAAILYEQSQQSVFQIRVIDLSTGKKSSLGSGFYITPQGHVVTNYHVIADYVMRPEHYRIEQANPDGTSEQLKLLYVDCVHDLALLQGGKLPQAFLKLSDHSPVKGERVFSLGNPHDFGFTIIEGTFNGLMKESRYRKLLFSGALNPGMSGGPAINHQGEVIGVNVSTMGNNLSFVVPVEFVREMNQTVQREGAVEVYAFKPLIERQLLKDQREHLQKILTAQWEKIAVGDLRVPGEIADVVKCWGKTYDEKNALMKKVITSCAGTDSLYLSSQIKTGYYKYQSSLHESKGLNALRLYHHLERDLASWFSLDGSIEVNDEDFTKPQCETAFVSLGKRTWKVATCARQYKQFRQLYDTELIFETVDQPHQGVLGHLQVMGVPKDIGAEFVRKFMREIRWQE